MLIKQSHEYYPLRHTNDNTSPRSHTLWKHTTSSLNALMHTLVAKRHCESLSRTHHILTNPSDNINQQKLSSFPSSSSSSSSSSSTDDDEAGNFESFDNGAFVGTGSAELKVVFWRACSCSRCCVVCVM